MESAYVTEWRHEVQRVLVDFEAKKITYYTHLQNAVNLKYNTSSLGSLWANLTALKYVISHY